MDIIEKKLNEIKPYDNNPRKNEKAVKYVANSIKEFGFKVPIVIDKDGVIVTGHTRYKAAKKLKLESVPCVIASDLTEEQIKAYRIADNKVGEISEWDDGLLNLEMFDLDNKIDMALFGFDTEIKDEKETVAEKQNRFEAMELKAFEHHDYLVFVFDNQMDWLKAVSVFDIHKVDAGYGKTKKIGVGRVLDGKRLLEKI